MRYFPALLPEVSDEDPVAELEAGRGPRLQELRLHNGTVYRWNRPIYDVVDGQPHLRVENRVLPAGPTVVDVLANAAFYYGAMRVLAEEERPVWTEMPFATAEENFTEGARLGMDADLYWPGFGEIPSRSSCCAGCFRGARGPGTLGRQPRRPRPLPGRHRAAGEERPQRGVLAGRDRARPGGAGDVPARGADPMLDLYLEGMHANEPVHTWPVP